LGNKREPRHAELLEFYSAWKKQKGTSYTTDYVLDETFTLLFRRLRIEDAKESVNVIEKGIERGYIRLERITAERFEMAKSLRMRFRDKPRISFTDLTSMVVMVELGISDILTEDEHFTQVGMGFQRVP
jgi:predicted nucleic acid-binding protein